VPACVLCSGLNVPACFRAGEDGLELTEDGRLTGRTIAKGDPVCYRHKGIAGADKHWIPVTPLES